MYIQSLSYAPRVDIQLDDCIISTVRITWEKRPIHRVSSICWAFIHEQEVKIVISLFLPYSPLRNTVCSCWRYHLSPYQDTASSSIFRCQKSEVYDRTCANWALHPGHYFHVPYLWCLVSVTVCFDSYTANWIFLSSVGFLIIVLVSKWLNSSGRNYWGPTPQADAGRPYLHSCISGKLSIAVTGEEIPDMVCKLFS